MLKRTCSDKSFNGRIPVNEGEIWIGKESGKQFTVIESLLKHMKRQGRKNATSN